MTDDANRIRQDLPPVQHSLRCLCRACVDARRDEVRSRREEAEREERRGREMAELEAVRHYVGPVYARMGAPRRPQPGTVRAINARYGKRYA